MKNASFAEWKVLTDDLIVLLKNIGEKSGHLEGVPQKDQKLVSEYITSLGHKFQIRPDDCIKGCVIFEIFLA